MSSFFVKFQYKDSIKKVQISKEDLTWDNICNILEKSFCLADKDKILLKYRDLENDEITVTSDQDLMEAYNLYFMKNLVKFIVCYSGVFKKNDKNSPEQSGYIKVDSSISIGKDSINNITNSQHANGNSTTDSKPVPQVDDGSVVSLRSKKEKNRVKVKVNSEELQNIFTEVFSNTEILNKIKGKLTNYIKDKKAGDDEVTEYSIETDYQSITKHIISSLDNILNSKIENSSVCIVDKSLSSSEESKSESSKKKGLLDIPMGESIYEPITHSTIEKDKDNDPPKSIKEVDSLSTSLSCKDLSTKLGVKLVLKIENGKARFVTMPAEMANSLEMSKSKEFEKIEDSPKKKIEEENDVENIDNIVLKLKKTSSKENKNYEFNNKILKSNIHDLDDDLPAPYNHDKIKKYEKGLEESVYEKIN